MARTCSGWALWFVCAYFFLFFCLTHAHNKPDLYSLLDFNEQYTGCPNDCGAAGNAGGCLQSAQTCHCSPGHGGSGCSFSYKTLYGSLDNPMHHVITHGASLSIPRMPEVDGIASVFFPDSNSAAGGPHPAGSPQLIAQVGCDTVNASLTWAAHLHANKAGVLLCVDSWLPTAAFWLQASRGGGAAASSSSSSSSLTAASTFFAASSAASSVAGSVSLAATGAHRMTAATEAEAAEGSADPHMAPLRAFLRATAAAGVGDYVVPMPAQSSEASQALASLNVILDLVHLWLLRTHALSNSEVLMVLHDWWPLLAPGGALLVPVMAHGGSDPGQAAKADGVNPSTTAAVHGFARVMGVPLFMAHSHWLLVKLREGKQSGGAAAGSGDAVAGGAGGEAAGAAGGTAGVAAVTTASSEDATSQAAASLVAAHMAAAFAASGPQALLAAGQQSFAAALSTAAASSDAGTFVAGGQGGSASQSLGAQQPHAATDGADNQAAGAGQGAGAAAAQATAFQQSPAAALPYSGSSAVTQDTTTGATWQVERGGDKWATEGESGGGGKWAMGGAGGGGYPNQANMDLATTDTLPPLQDSGALECDPQNAQVPAGWQPSCDHMKGIRVDPATRTVSLSHATFDTSINLLGPYYQALSIAQLLGYTFVFEGSFAEGWLQQLPARVEPGLVCPDVSEVKRLCELCTLESQWELTHTCPAGWVKARHAIQNVTREALQTWVRKEAQPLPAWEPTDAVIQVRCSRDTLLADPTYGPAAFSFYTNYMPPDTKRVFAIYAHHGPGTAATAAVEYPPCDRIVEAMGRFIKRHRRKTSFAVLNGKKWEDFARLVTAPLVFREAGSSWGLWASLASPGRVFSPALVAPVAGGEAGAVMEKVFLPNVGGLYKFVQVPVLYPALAAEQLELKVREGAGEYPNNMLQLGPIITWLEVN